MHHEYYMMVEHQRRTQRREIERARLRAALPPCANQPYMVRRVKRLVQRLVLQDRGRWGRRLALGGTSPIVRAVKPRL